MQVEYSWLSAFLHMQAPSSDEWLVGVRLPHRSYESRTFHYQPFDWQRHTYLLSSVSQEEAERNLREALRRDQIIEAEELRGLNSSSGRECYPERIP